MVFTCGTCYRAFPKGWRARNQHCEAVGHDNPDDIPDFECDTYSNYFCDEEDRQYHMQREAYWPDAEECSVCVEMFPSHSECETHEHEHLNSKVHRPSTVHCPFCDCTCGTATGLVHHLERGNCPRAPLDRDKLYRVVRQYDPNGTISKKLIGWNGSPSYQASSAAYNYNVGAYECYLCHNLFNTLGGLNQHLASPKHQQALYHCPNLACRRDFTTLAGLINHLESESCSFMRFSAVQTNINAFVNPNGMLTFG